MYVNYHSLKDTLKQCGDIGNYYLIQRCIQMAFLYIETIPYK